MINPETFFAAHTLTDYLLRVYTDAQKNHDCNSKHENAMKFCLEKAKIAVFHHDIPNALKWLSTYHNIHTGYLNKEILDNEELSEYMDEYENSSS